MLAKWGSLSHFIGEVTEPREASDLFKVSWLRRGPVLSRARLPTLVLALLTSWLPWAPPRQECFPNTLHRPGPGRYRKPKYPTLGHLGPGNWVELSYQKDNQSCSALACGCLGSKGSLRLEGAPQKAYRLLRVLETRWLGRLG